MCPGKWFVIYVAYLDEFGHIGPYVSADHAQHNTSPVFGLGGIILPLTESRSFGTWFFQRKSELLDWEIKRADRHPATWEKKGSQLFTTTNIEKYPELRKMTNRFINKIKTTGGIVFFVGIEKYEHPETHSAKGLYHTVLREAIRRIDSFCVQRDSRFIMILDEHPDRVELLETAAKAMYMPNGARTLIEPPFQVESHLYQTVQCADWISALVNRLWCYRVDPIAFEQFEWAEKLFGRRIGETAQHSSLRRKPARMQPTQNQMQSAFRAARSDVRRG